MWALFVDCLRTAFSIKNGSLTGPCFLQSFIVNLITEQAVKQLAVVAVSAVYCLRKFTQQINLSSKPRVKGALKPGCRII